MSGKGQSKGFVQAEAYCLMLYRCEGVERHEITMWNSRDGVTPFVIECARCKSEMKHEEWGKDRCVPDHLPAAGDMVFVNLTIGRALVGARKMVEKYWDHPEYPMSKAYPGMSKDEAVGVKAQEFVGDGKNPDIVEVTEQMRSEFKLRANTVEGRRPDWMRSGRHG